MRIGFVGAGKVATAFGRYLHIHDVDISGYFDRHPEKVDHACRGTDSLAYSDAGQAADGSDILLITTQDDKIGDACDDLCRREKITARHLVGHMSGVHSSQVLKSAGDKGAAIFSLHPLQAFADEQMALRDLPNTYFSLESEDERAAAVEKILRTTGNPFFRISPEKKALYHLSACILSNYLVTVMDSGLTALEHSGIDPQEGYQAMQPLIRGTLANIAKSGTAKALTGPIARGDAGTIRQHLDALEMHHLDTIQSFYKSMGRKTLDLAEKQILKAPDKAEAVRRLLDNK